MLYSEIIAVCSQIYTNTLCGQNVELLNVEHGGTSWSDNEVWVFGLQCQGLRGYMTSCGLVDEVTVKTASAVMRVE
jgi:hypothetical protein